MITEILVTVGIASGVNNMMQSDKINNQADEKMCKAHRRLAMAQRDHDAEKKKFEEAIVRIHNRKRAALISGIEKFVNTYRIIKEIKLNVPNIDSEFENALLDDNVMMLQIKQAQMNKMGNVISANVIKSCLAGGTCGLIGIKNISNAAKDIIKGTNISTSSGMVSGLTTIGVGAAVMLFDAASASILDDAKDNLKIAKMQSRQSDAMAGQINIICKSYEAVVNRINMLDEVIVRLNSMLIFSVENINKIIKKNGEELRNYSKEEISQIGACAELAKSLKALIDVPIIDWEGEVTKQSLEAIKFGNDILNKLNNNLT